jgi:hypothetical protein
MRQPVFLAGVAACRGCVCRPVDPNLVVLMGVQRYGPEGVSLSDPSFRDRELFFASRDKLEAA